MISRRDSCVSENKQKRESPNYHFEYAGGSLIFEILFLFLSTRHFSPFDLFIFFFFCLSKKVNKNARQLCS